jgi:predicted LPLAT superfamily acyltransferase
MIGSVGTPQSHDWTAQRERGSRPLLAVMFWISQRLGWHTGQLLLYPITAWFYCSSPAARAASRDYLARVLEWPPRQRDVMRHMFTFACVILDRIFFLSGRTGAFKVTVEGLQTLTDILNSGRGCILLGSHLGSFDVLRAFGRTAPVRVSPVMFRRNSGHLTSLLERLDPELARDVIEVGRPGAMLRVHECVDRGEMVALLADRAPVGRQAGERVMSAEFLGAMADFPTAPLSLAAILGAPVVLFYGTRVGPRRYSVRFEPFAERIVLPRTGRDEALRGYVQAYSRNLAANCRANPFNWFNFFPFWKNRPG